MGMSRYALAKAIGVPPRRINEIVFGKRAISANSALRLGAALGTTAEFWMNLQQRHDLDSERSALKGKLKLIRRIKLVDSTVAGAA